MTQPRRPDEVALFNTLRARPDRPSTRTTIIAICDELGIQHNRAFYLLEKWGGKDWWDYGTWAWGGWFTEQAPQSLTATTAVMPVKIDRVKHPDIP